MVAQGHFREDLYYRLNTIRIDVPPLRERPDDVACLAAHFVARFNRRFAQDKQLSPEAVEALTRYSWPGNVRQLINVIEQVVVLADEDVIAPAHLPPIVRSARRAGRPAPSTRSRDRAPARRRAPVHRVRDAPVRRSPRTARPARSGSASAASTASSASTAGTEARL